MTSKSWSHDLCVVIKFRAKQKRKKITTLTIYSNNWFLWVLFVYARGAPWVQYNMHFTVKKKTHRKEWSCRHIHAKSVYVLLTNVQTNRIAKGSEAFLYLRGFEINEYEEKQKIVPFICSRRKHFMQSIVSL